MQVEATGNALLVVGDDAGYRLRVSLDQPHAALLDTRGEPLAEMDLGSGLDTTDGPDDATVLGAPEVLRAADGLTLTWRGHSARWPTKEVRLSAGPDGVAYRYRVQGAGAITQAHFFRTATTAPPARFTRLFSPQPNGARQMFFGADEPTVIPVYDTDDVPGSTWFFTPAPTCFVISHGAMERAVATEPGVGSGLVPDRWQRELPHMPWPVRCAAGDEPPPYRSALVQVPAQAAADEPRPHESVAGDWMGVGVGAPIGEWRFTSLSYPGSGFGLTLAYDGQTVVRGDWQSPTVLLLPAADPYAALERYTHELRVRGWAPLPAGRTVPEWWRQPFFCGWGEQVALEQLQPGTQASDLCTQANYERWLAVLEQHGAEPGTIVVDDQWQAAYGLNEPDVAKWPDLRGFVQRQHARGRRVLLWLKAWDATGLPDAECLLHPDGQRRVVDPGNPAYAHRLAEQVRRLLSDFGADGFKIDFTASIPHGPGWSASAGGQWGLELLRTWLGIVAQAARAVRPDVLLVGHAAHPLFADVLDVLRLNDLPAWWPAASPDEFVAAMGHRARVAHAAGPAWLLESDNWPLPDRATWRVYLAAQASGQLGIPSLYYAEHVGVRPPIERLVEEDYVALRDAWAAYRRAVGIP